MVESAILITNNELAVENLKDKLQTVFTEGMLIDVLKTVRDYVHKGHRLLTHPLAGSIKPNETPYKSVLISKAKGETTDMDSLILIENSIHTAEKFLNTKMTPEWPARVLDDFRLIDFDLINNAIK